MFSHQAGLAIAYISDQEKPQVPGIGATRAHARTKLRRECRKPPRGAHCSLPRANVGCLTAFEIVERPKGPSLGRQEAGNERNQRRRGSAKW